MTIDSLPERMSARRLPGRANGKRVVDLASDVLADMASLLQAELQLLRAEISEKLNFTAVSGALIVAGALLLMTTIMLLTEAAIAALVDYGFPWPVAILIIAAATAVLGGACVWFGLNRLRLERLAPSKTLGEFQKDIDIANLR